jgi:hypothetical protein
VNFLSEFLDWLRRTFNPTPFDKGYAWAKEELWWGVLSEDVLIQCGNTDHRSNFDRELNKP